MIGNCQCVIITHQHHQHSMESTAQSTNDMRHSEGGDNDDEKCPASSIVTAVSLVTAVSQSHKIVWGISIAEESLKLLPNHPLQCL